MTTAELTAAVMRHLKITWTSNDTTATVDSIMSRAASMLNDLLGVEVDYSDASTSGRDLDLYLNLCLYLYNGLTEDEFLEAYNRSLITARLFHVDPINMDEEDEEA